MHKENTPLSEGHLAFISQSNITAEKTAFDTWNISTPGGQISVDVTVSLEDGIYSFTAMSPSGAEQRKWVDTDLNQLRTSVIQELSLDTRTQESCVESVENFMSLGKNKSLGVMNGNAKDIRASYAAYTIDVLQREVGLYGSAAEYLHALEHKVYAGMRQGLIIDDTPGQSPIVLALFRDGSAIALHVVGEDYSPESSKAHLVPACFVIDLESHSRPDNPYKCKLRVNKNPTPGQDTLHIVWEKGERIGKVFLPIGIGELPEIIQGSTQEIFEGIRSTVSAMWSLPPVQRPSEEGIDAGTVVRVDPIGIWADEKGLHFYWPRCLSQRTCRLDVIEDERQVVQDIVDLALLSDPILPEGYTVAVTGHAEPGVEEIYIPNCIDAPWSMQNFASMETINQLSDEIQIRISDLQAANAFKIACDGTSARFEETVLLKVKGKRPDEKRATQLIEKYGYVFAGVEARHQETVRRAHTITER